MRTKIIATLGPSSNNKETMKAMVEYGVRIFRLNFSHANAASFEPTVALIREIESETGVALTAMGDLCGPKTRIGEVEGSPRTVNKGEVVNLGLPDQRGKGEHLFIELDFPELLKGLDVDMPVSLSDGMLQFHVSRVVTPDKLYELTAHNGGILTSNKGIAFPGKFHPVPAMTPKDRKDLDEGMEIGLDAVALSFVQGPQDVKDLKDAIARHDRNIPTVAKLERQNAVDNLDAILDLTDSIMVARGDLGLECPLSTVPVLQKRILRATRHKQRAGIVATQMLLSMVKNPLPTRAETADVANAMLDGADCVMLSEETAIGSYPVEAVKFMSEIAASAEAYYLERTDGPYMPRKENNPDKFMAYAASLLAVSSESKGICCHSTSGATARLISSRRPPVPIYGLTTDPTVLRMLNFFWGVTPSLSEKSVPSHMHRVQRFVVNSEIFQPGNSVVLTSGQPTPGQPKPHTNQLKLFYK